MFKHIAIPTDGSKLSAKGVKAGMRLAQSLGARVTGVYVVPPYRPHVYGEAAAYYVPGMTPDDYRKESLRAAKKALASVEIEAQTAGVRCATRIVTAVRPHAGILRAARAAKCDAIAMASHHHNFDAYVALGCVIGGDTVADTLYRETCRGLTQLSAQGIPIGNGVLLAEHERAALSLADEGDAGGDAARAALALATLRERLAIL